MEAFVNSEFNMVHVFFSKYRPLIVYSIIFGVHVTRIYLKCEKYRLRIFKIVCFSKQCE